MFTTWANTECVRLENSKHTTDNLAVRASAKWIALAGLA